MGYADIEGSGNFFTWTTSSYKKELVEEFKRIVPPGARKWNKGYGRYNSRGHWEVSAKYFNDVISLSNKYGFDVDIFGSVEEPESRQYRIKLDYMGLVRHRGGEIYTASGWVDNGWNAVFSLSVLQEWFKFSLNPGQMPTLFSVVGVDSSLTGIEFDKALKKAYRRAARTWHPDINQEPEAHETFQKINEAYEKLKDPMFRKRYEAGLKFQKDVESGSAVYGSNAINWKPPVRCGHLTIQATKSMGKYSVEKIFDWQDIKNVEGETLVTYWLPGASFFSEKWVQ